jgi:hypothetical protein
VVAEGLEPDKRLANQAGLSWQIWPVTNLPAPAPPLVGAIGAPAGACTVRFPASGLATHPLPNGVPPYGQ